MRKSVLLLFISWVFCLSGNGQSGNDEKLKISSSNQVSLNLYFPFGGYLKDISNFGIGTQYEWSKNRFGKMSLVSSNSIGFTFNIGADYYFGQKEDVGPYTYKYEGTTYLHAYAGGIYNISNRGNLSLTAGPSLELYDGITEFGFGVNLSGCYYMCGCGKFGFSPNITLMKQGKSEAVLAGGIRAILAF